MVQRRGFWKRAGTFMGAAALGTSLLGVQHNARAQGIQRTNTTQKARTVQVELQGAKGKTNAFRTTAAQMTREAREAKIIAAVLEATESGTKVMNRNTSMHLYGACSNAFAAQKLSFGTNELRRSIITLKQALNVPRVRNAWMRGNTNEVRTAYNWGTVTPDLMSVKEQKGYDRREAVLVLTAQMPLKEKREIIAALVNSKH